MSEKNGRPQDLDATRGPRDSAADDDPRLFAALQQYLSEIEAGRRPNRQAFLAQHADIAEELSACLQGLTFVQSAAAQITGAAAAPAPEPDSLLAADLSAGRPLGDFRLVRELGRGGMGVVYEAVQLSLDRRVAVKVLPFAAALDSRLLQRFRNEAQAAAQLHHTNIVPVYAVGCERSVHFYAMQLIEGQSLAEIIRELRSAAGLAEIRGERSTQGPGPLSRRIVSMRTAAVSRDLPSSSLHVATTVHKPGPFSTDAVSLSVMRSSKPSSYYRFVARLGLQAAEALDYAHNMGVVHRDIKPANLLLDIRGNLWITDFGLAQLYADNSLTRTGDLVGTFRYMSPEQASGRAVVLDQRTDIYSLGITLYELLALQRALPGETREQLLRQIDLVEPRPLRAIDKAIPAELETILAKAIAKDPAARYPTARALADDLGRFLRDEPILARPPSLWDKAVKWTRRHRSLAASALVMLLLTAIGLATSTVLIAREQAKTKAAYDSERKKAFEADQQRARAERSFAQAREAVDFFARIAADELDKPEFGDVRKAMLEASLSYYQRFLEDRKDDRTIGLELDAARLRVSTILGELSAFGALYHVQFRLRLLSEKAVQDDLHFPADQVNRIKQATDEQFAKAGAGFQDLRHMTPEQKRDRFSAMAREVESELNQLLTRGQAERLRQIARQVRGPKAFSDPDVSEALSLSRDQKDRIRSVQADFFEARFRRGRWEESVVLPDAFQDEAIDNILAQLTRAQVATWKVMIGKPFVGTVFSRDRGFGPPRRRP